MTKQPTITTLQFYPKSSSFHRHFALWYFCALISLWNILGHTVFGFEQALIHPLIAVATAVAVHFLLEWVDAWSKGRKTRFSGSVADFVNFLPPAIIAGLACAMMLYPNERWFPIIFAVTLSLASKVLFRAPVGNGRSQHIFNPSNLGITATLLLFPWVGLAPPYHFTENLTGVGHWLLPGVILVTGIIVHAFFTGRLPLVLAWIVGFILQGQLRRWYFGTSWIVPFAPMTSAAFILFTLYMIPDPATTPLKWTRQVLYGLMIASIYGLLQVLHIVFGLFLALAISSALRGAGLYAEAMLQALRSRQPKPGLTPTLTPSLEPTVSLAPTYSRDPEPATVAGSGTSGS